MPKRIFLSRAHPDRRLKDALLTDLRPALGLLQDVSVEWRDELPRFAETGAIFANDLAAAVRRGLNGYRAL
jgi:hypothetical protein